MTDILDPCSEDYEEQFGEEIEHDGDDGDATAQQDSESRQENELFDQIIGAIEDILVGKSSKGAKETASN
jgi:hypothetical protein